ncbi:efflux RND transporter periplasmic adaptor subunit [Tardiphaga sp.]|uniref:efflux RND transporter periplasmic adaptor subunit n=1 Tax=Tardiphaga sp. TaxID=1926292 RepID=UPI00263604B6|nr:efflux RND transporter periplasmic adaptor subunit [Tardiphaga sp.]MDB5617848.1 efflux transporter periplasmic adaptor subunit [Tardiphaga sp.]
MSASNDHQNIGNGQQLPLRSRRARIIVVVSLIAMAGTGVFWYGKAYRPVAKSTAAAAIPVTAVKASVRDLPIERSGLGTVLPLNQVDVKVRVDGQLQRIAFIEGQDVQAGDLLAEIDLRPYKAQLDGAEATLQKDLAQLASDRTEDARAAKLTISGAGTGQAADKAKAQVAIMQATVLGDQAAVDTAKINLSYTHILAAITGRVGLKQINQGAIIHANDTTGLVTITQIHPISVQFSLPQDELPDLLAGQAKAPLQVTVHIRDGSKLLATGRLTVIDSQVDTLTGMIKLKAEFDNNDGSLWPGELVTARVVVRSDRNTTVVPSAAVQNGQNGAYVFVINPANTVALAKIRTGPTVGDVTALTSGINPGDNIVLSGQSRLTQGTLVSVTQSDNKTASSAARTE